jgi:XTP/dITP diphosphohydrolase
MKRMIVATGNPHKVEEFESLLELVGFEICSAGICGGMPEVVEDGDSFSANAAIKARALRAVAPVDAWIVSDDSGLEVEALGGAPGIYSARYAGEQASDAANVDKLLNALQPVSMDRRAARFRCVLCLIDPHGEEHFFEGACSGDIAMAPQGSAGFGYDPVFVPNGYVASFAELGEAVKAGLSHRAKAVQALKHFIDSNTCGSFEM